MIYDHTNYSRWGMIYIIDMLQLETSAPGVYHEFTEGNFVVKESNGSFNQISPDQALEHINKKCKIAGGLVGLTRRESDLNSWMVTFGERARLADDAKNLVGIEDKESVIHDDRGKGRLNRDASDVTKLEAQIRTFNPFGRDTYDLISIATNDVAPPEVKYDLLSAMGRGSAG